jgi:hypothetical protein
MLFIESDVILGAQMGGVYIFMPHYRSVLSAVKPRDRMITTVADTGIFLVGRDFRENFFFKDVCKIVYFGR